MRIGPRLSLVVLVTTVLALSTASHSISTDDEDMEGSHWRWPGDETGGTRLGAGRLIPDRRPSSSFQPIFPSTTTRPLPSRTRTPSSSIPFVSKIATTTTTTAKTPAAAEETAVESAPKKNESSVPLLKDAGKPGNPYILLNDVLPPKDFIRTPAEEEANLNSLQNKNLGGLDASEVWLADDDLFVVRGFNLKKPYAAEPLAGPPISDYVAPAPRPPPPPEPGTVFYPSNKTEETFNNFFNPNGGQPDFSSFPPYPFLPPPPPQWTEEKEFNNNNDIRDPFQSLNGGPPGFSLFNGSFGFPPSSGLPPGFPGGFPQQGGQQQQQGPPQGFPQGGPPPPGAGGNNNNATVPDDDDEDVPFTPLFPERPVEFYFPTHDTVEKPPGPNGPGVFVPPPLKYFAPRDPNEIINVDIPQKLFRPPFNLPNYYQKTSAASAVRAPGSKTTTAAAAATATRPGTVQSVANKPVAVDLPSNVNFKEVKVPTSAAHVDLNKPCNHALPQQPIPLAFRPQNHQQQQQQQQKVTNFYPGLSLHGDTDVNYKFPRPNVNPDSELIHPLSNNKPKLPPTAWNPYTIHHPADILQSWAQQHQHQQPALLLPYEDKSSSFSSPSSTSPDSPPNYVSVYRTGTGSYSYNLGGRRR